MTQPSLHARLTLVLAGLLAAGAARAAEPFVEMAAATGLDFVHFNGMSGRYYFVEILGSGGALLDYDNDGDVDVYLAQGALLGKDVTLAQATFPPPASAPSGGRLYRNDLVVNADGTRTLKFTDVTAASGLRAGCYGMGVTTGDYDNDGRMDLYLTCFGPSQLWRNRGDGTFEDATARAGVPNGPWAVSASFLDYDRDGWLDLYVGNYVDYSLETDRACYAPSGARDYCSPRIYRPVPDRLYRNKGDGTFEDAGAKAGTERDFGAALGVVAVDFNLDGWIDLYVANDANANQMWMNQKNGSFRNDALLGGTAVNMEGAPQGSMGVDAGDFDGDGDEDLFFTNLMEEYSALLVNDGQGWFEDRSLAAGLATASKGYTGFGASLFDYDNDGVLDVFVANGEVRVVPILARAGDRYPLHQKNQLYHGLGNGTFRDVSADAGPALALSEVSRGAAFGDMDNDGDSDILVTNNSGPVRLLVNTLYHRTAVPGQAPPATAGPAHWLGLRLLARSGRDALGARVVVRRPGGPDLVRRVRSAASYASASDPRALVGIGAADRVEGVRVQWPTGETEEFTGLAVDRYHTLQQGKGETKP